MTGDIRQQLIEALKAAEDLAREAAHTWVDGSTGVWKAQPDSYHSDLIVDEGNGEIVVYDEGRPTAAQALHIARWDPSTVLRLIERDRAMVADLDGAEAAVDAKVRSYRGAPDNGELIAATARCKVLREEAQRAAAFWLGTPEVDHG